MINRNFGKLESGNIKYAPNPLWVGEKMIANPTNDMYLNNGYKPIEYKAMPNKDGYYFTPTYTEINNAIIQGWEEHIIIDDEIV